MPRIFIIDDDDFILRSLRRVLHRPGYQVDGFSSAEEALQRLADAPDLVICDYHLPRVDGLAVSAEVKRVSPHTRTLLLSGGIEDDAVIAALQAHTIDRFTTKPWHHDELIAVVESLLDGA